VEYTKKKIFGELLISVVKMLMQFVHIIFFTRNIVSMHFVEVSYLV